MSITEMVCSFIEITWKHEGIMEWATQIYILKCLAKKNEIIFRVFLIKPLRSQRDSQFVLANSAFKRCSEMLFCKKKKHIFFLVSFHLRQKEEHVFQVFAKLLKKGGTEPILLPALMPLRCSCHAYCTLGFCEGVFSLFPRTTWAISTYSPDPEGQRQEMNQIQITKVKPTERDPEKKLKMWLQRAIKYQRGTMMEREAEVILRSPVRTSPDRLTDDYLVCAVINWNPE